MSINRVSVSDDSGGGTDGTILNASFFTSVYDSIEEKPRASAYHNTTQSINDATITVLNLNTEDYDSTTLHDTAVNNSRITIPSSNDGTYLINGYVSFAANATGARYADIFKNGTTILSTILHGNAGASRVTILNITGIFALSAGDYVELRGFQESGGALNTGSGTASSANRLQVFKLF